MDLEDEDRTKVNKEVNKLALMPLAKLSFFVACFGLLVIEKHFPKRAAGFGRPPRINLNLREI